MRTTFYAAAPHEPLLLSHLADWLPNAKQFDLTVAFLTKFGADLLLELLAAEPDQIRIAASIRFPTSMDALNSLHERWPGRIFIHRGYRSPQESNADRAQMHSKVAVIVDKTGPIRALIGSHNWTYMALRGFNGEASVVARGVETDRVIINTRAHVEATIAECEVFDPDRIEFYKEVQTRLHRGPQQNENIIVYPSYVQRRVLVVHAEVHDASLLREQSLQLYLPLGFAPERDLPVGTAVEVYLYEPETLFGHPPTSTPVLFVGDLVTSNRIESGRITGKEIDSAISDQNLPVVDRTTDLPTNRPVGFECVAKVKSKGRSRTRIYHAKEAKPGTKVSLAYEEAKDPRPALSDGGRSDIKEYLYSGDATFKQPIGETEESTLLVPRADLVYDENPYWRLAQKLGKGRGSEGLRRRAAAQKSEAAEKAPHREWETPYIYFAEGSIDDSAE